MALAPITDEQRKHIIEDINYDKDQMQKKLEHIKEWMEKQPHLPEVPEKINEKRIHSFLLGTKLSTEKAKHKIDTYYAMRHQIPEIFQNRDPLQEDVKASVDAYRFFPLSELTPDGIRTIIAHMNPDKDKKATARDLKGFYKRIMAVSDARMEQSDFCRGEYVVMDCVGLYLSHMTELPWVLVQRFNALIQEGLPVRVKGVLLINAPSFIETVLNIFRPILKEKIKNRIQVFQGDHTNLYKFIPQRILPSDYGGEGPSLQESSREWQKTLESMREFIIEDDKRVTDEAKRPLDSTNDCGQLFGVNGTFNKLNID